VAVFSKVGVVGAGLMGSGIAEVCARSGVGVSIAERDRQAAVDAQGRIERSLANARERGKLSGEEVDETLRRLSFADELAALADCDLVIEAIVEDENAKVALFSELDRVLESEDAVIASNTSSIPIMKLAMATGRAQQVIGIHFFNPVPVLPLVEVIVSLHTSPETTARTVGFAREQLGKNVIEAQDRAGFIVNALLIPYLLSAVRMLESGFASAEDIDMGMVKGCAHPMGPLALTDLIGLDTTMAVAESLYEEFKEPLYAPPPLLSRMVDAGLLGRKSGRGFHSYA
jgi:3-hydroxybutyryl-CoA dehydrogenase